MKGAILFLILLGPNGPNVVTENFSSMKTCDTARAQMVNVLSHAKVGEKWTLGNFDPPKPVYASEALISALCVER